MIKLINILNELEIQDPDNITRAFEHVAEIHNIGVENIYEDPIEINYLKDLERMYSWIKLPEYSKEWFFETNNNGNIFISNIPPEIMKDLLDDEPYNIIENFYDDEGHQLYYAII